MRLESAFAINLRIAISVVVGAGAAFVTCLVKGQPPLDGVGLALMVSAGVLLASYAVIPAQVDQDRP
ncbi:hypothetical protein RHOFW510R12_00555 [Rhodanobacter sp. FW510-R12]|uniref:hypothetical protein n=1 Tax=Rhodanobacter thiooxydans TaxID=416169 RepID=UPI0009184BDC|nr:hypothetical protein [Rhodanobacter thiooxydans]UJJ56731.1 hypothetical protein LRK53_19175 [Rhodanobacter thiooxydans]